MESALNSVCDVLKKQNVAEHILEELVEETAVLQLNTMSAEVIDNSKLWCIETIFDAKVNTPLRIAAAAVTLKIIQNDTQLALILESKLVASIEPVFMSVDGNGKALEVIACGFAMVVPDSARLHTLMETLFRMCAAIASTAVGASVDADFSVAIRVVTAIISRIFRSAVSCPPIRSYLDTRGSQWLLKYCDLLLQCPQNSLVQGRDVVCKAVVSSLVESLVVGVASTGDALTLVSLLSFACDRLLTETADGDAGGDLATGSMLLAIAMKAVQELETRGDVKGNGKASSGPGGKGKSKGKDKKKAPPVPAAGTGIGGGLAPGATGSQVEVDTASLYAQIVARDGFFDCLCDMLLSESIIVRKRAIYLLEHAVVHVTSSTATDSTAAECDGYLGRRYWLQDFIDIYHQVDGCSSAHLIDQVWTHARHLFQYVYAVEAAVAAGRAPRSGHPALPPVAFKWTKIIVNAVLASKSATVRKTMVYRLLACRDSAETLLLFPTAEVIRWFCFDMLKRLDQAAVFFGGIGHRSSQISLTASAFEPAEDAVSASDGDVGYKVVLTDADYRLHPGLLLPHFVREFNLQILSHPEAAGRASLSRLLHSSLMQMTCLTDDAVVRSSSVHASRPAVGLGSLLAIKWLMRAFPLVAQPAPKEQICGDSYDILRSSAGTGLYACCCEEAECSCHYFGLEELYLVNQMLSSKFLSANLAIASQVLDGLLPWLFSRVHVGSQTAATIHAGGSQQRYACLVLKSMLTILSTGSASSKSADSSQSSPLTRMLEINLEQVRGAIGRVVMLITDDAEIESCFGQAGMQLLGMAHVLSPVDMPFLTTRMESALVSSTMAATFTPGNVMFLNGVGMAIHSVVATAAEESAAKHRALQICRSFSSPVSGGLLELSYHLASHIGGLLALTSDAFTLKDSAIYSLDVLDACCNLLGHCVMLTALGGEQLPTSSGVVTLLMQCSARLNDATETGEAVIRKVLASRAASQLMKSVSATTSGQAVLPPLMPSLVECLVTVPDITMADYKSAREVLLAADRVSAGTATSSTLVTDLLMLFDRFSRCANHFMVCRWSATHACVRVLGAVELALPGLESDVGISPADKLLDFLTGHIDCCIPQVTTMLIRCARAMCASAFKPSDTAGFDSKSVGKLESFIASCWHSCVNDGAQENIGAIGAFIEFVFDPAIFAAVGFDAVEEYLDKLIALGANWRPYIMQCLVLHLVALWKLYPMHSIPFFRRHIKTLVLYKEPILDDHTLVDSLSVSTADEAVCRCMVLQFIEGLKGGMVTVAANNIGFREQLQECLDDFVVELMTMHMETQYVPCAMVGTDQFGEKLRSWQTLCIMSTHVTSALLNRVVTVPVGKETREFTIKELYFVLMLQNVAHNIRVHVEIFGAALLLQFPEEMLPPFYSALEECNTQQQILASYFIILGHLLVDLDDQTGSTHLPQHHYEPMAARLIPWLSCAGGLPRCIAQLAIFEIIPRIIDVSKPVVGESVHFAYLRAIYSFLVSNKDSVKMVQRQRRFFSDAPIRSRLTLEGLMRYVAADHTGERVPEHLVSVVVATLKSLEYSFSNESKSILLQIQDPEEGEISAGRAAAASAAEDSAPCFQTKRTPFEELQIHMADASAARHRNASGRRRQDVIVCASLIDKPVNVAGIARTCEIFAVEMMTLASMDITRTDDFQAVAVSCTEWLPMEEVTEANLLPFIHRCRQKGYTIVGLEQTETSIDLSDPAQTALLPQKCVLILGKEKEGVPVHILDQLDVCLEIPQFGVIRSLNVHVSAAMALWEITKNNMPSLKSTME